MSLGNIFRYITLVDIAFSIYSIKYIKYSIYRVFTKVLVQTSATSRKYHFKHFFINEKKSKNASFFNY